MITATRNKQKTKEGYPFAKIDNDGIGKFQFTQLPKALFQDEDLKALSVEAKVIYAFMLSRKVLSMKNHWSDKGQVYITYTHDSAAELLGCGRGKIARAYKSLENAKLIQKTKKGVRAASHIFVKSIMSDSDSNDSREGCEKAYYRFPRIFLADEPFRDLSLNAKVLYTLMLDRMSISIRSLGWEDDYGYYILFPVREAADALGCSTKTAGNVFEELERFGLIDRRSRGVGYKARIYVRNFLLLSEEDYQDDEDLDCQDEDYQDEDYQGDEENDAEYVKTRTLPMRKFGTTGEKIWNNWGVNLEQLGRKNGTTGEKIWSTNKNNFRENNFRKKNISDTGLPSCNCEPSCRTKDIPYIAYARGDCFFGDDKNFFADADEKNNSDFGDDSPQPSVCDAAQQTAPVQPEKTIPLLADTGDDEDFPSRPPLTEAELEAERREFEMMMSEPDIQACLEFQEDLPPDYYPLTPEEEEEMQKEMEARYEALPPEYREFLEGGRATYDSLEKDQEHGDVEAQNNQDSLDDLPADWFEAIDGDLFGWSDACEVPVHGDVDAPAPCQDGLDETLEYFPVVWLETVDGDLFGWSAPCEVPVHGDKDAPAPCQFAFDDLLEGSECESIPVSSQNRVCERLAGDVVSDATAAENGSESVLSASERYGDVEAQNNQDSLDDLPADWFEAIDGDLFGWSDACEVPVHGDVDAPIEVPCQSDSLEDLEWLDNDEECCGGDSSSENPVSIAPCTALERGVGSAPLADARFRQFVVTLLVFCCLYGTLLSSEEDGPIGGFVLPRRFWAKACLDARFGGEFYFWFAACLQLQLWCILGSGPGLGGVSRAQPKMGSGAKRTVALLLLVLAVFCSLADSQTRRQWMLLSSPLHDSRCFGKVLLCLVWRAICCAVRGENLSKYAGCGIIRTVDSPVWRWC